MAAKAKPTKSPKREKRGDRQRRKSCSLCQNKVDSVDYKDIDTLRRFVSERGKLRGRRVTGACRRHNTQISNAVKRAREIALLPYVADR